MFITALFTIAKTWRQPKYSLTDKWIKKMWYLQNRNRLTDIENKLMVTKVERWGRDKLGVWD